MTAFQSVSPSASLNWERSHVPLTHRGSDHTALSALAARVAAADDAAAARAAAPASLPAAFSPSSVPPRSSGPGARVFVSAATRVTTEDLDEARVVRRREEWVEETER